MDAGVGARVDGAEEAAGAPSFPLRSAAPAQGEPSSLLRSAAPAPGAPSSPLHAAAPAPGEPSSPLRAAGPAPAAPSSPLRSAALAQGAPSSPRRSAVSAPGSPLASDVSDGGAGRAIRNLCREVVSRLVAGGRLEASAFDLDFYDMLATHFARFPESYHLYVKSMKAEDVITHMKLLEEAKDPNRRPAIHVQFLRAEEQTVDTTINRDDAGDSISTRQELSCSNIHEIIFGSGHHPMLLSQLSAILSDVGLNVKHVNVFSTSDGLCLCVFTVQGWHTEIVMGLVDALKSSILTNERSCSIFCSTSYVTTPTSPAYFSSNSSGYATAPEPLSLARNDRIQTRADDSSRRLRIIKMRKRAEKVKQQKMMESFRAILSDSISFLFPAMLAIFTSSLDFHNSEKPILIMVFSMGGLLILLNMVLSHGVEDGPGRTEVVSLLTMLTVIYVFGVFEYFLYKFFPAGDYQVTALHCIGAHFIFGVLMLKWLWAYSFKTSS